MVKLTNIFLPEQQNIWEFLTWQRNEKESAVSDNCLQCDCIISFDNFDVLASDTNNFRLLIKESLLIKRDKPILNRTIKSFPLKLFD